MKDKTTSYNSGISLTSLLTVLFIGLKLTDYIDWSWWWVLSPLWLPIVVVLGVFTVIGLVWLVAAAVSTWWR